MKNVTQAEERFCFYQLELCGDFYENLFRTMLYADEQNLWKMSLAFPEETDVYRRYRTDEMYWDDLKRRWNEEVSLNLKLI